MQIGALSWQCLLAQKKRGTEHQKHAVSLMIFCVMNVNVLKLKYPLDSVQIIRQTLLRPRQTIIKHRDFT